MSGAGTPGSRSIVHRKRSRRQRYRQEGNGEHKRTCQAAQSAYAYLARAGLKSQSAPDGDGVSLFQPTKT